MRTTTESKLGWLVLALCHVAGMLDLVILPLWVGGVMQTYKFQAISAGGLVTIYLVGTLLTNALLSRSYGRLPERATAFIGFAVPAIAFFLMTYVPSFTALSSYSALAILHFIGGMGAGAGLVMVHGSIGRSANPHRLFAIVNVGMSVFAIAFFGIMPVFMQKSGVNAVFIAVGVMAAIASLAALLAFPRPPQALAGPALGTAARRATAPGILALCFLGVVFLQTGQAMTFSFVERIGDFRAFGPDRISAMLIVGSFVPLLAPIAAGLLQYRLSPLPVAIGGLIFHGILSATVSNSSSFLPYAIAASLMISTVIFTHTFIFGLLAKLDPSGRTNAMTPSMLMIGTAIGPFVGGAVGDIIGYPAIGTTALVAALLGATCFVLVRQKLNAGSGMLAASAA